MTGFRMTEPQAFSWIQRTARVHRMTPHEAAERLLSADQGSDPS